MVKEKKTVHRIQMTEGKRQIIQQLLQEYNIETTGDHLQIDFGEQDVMIGGSNVRIHFFVSVLGYSRRI